MQLVPLTPGGVSLLDDDDVIPMDRALTCTDCYTDAGSLVSRNGYRKISASAIGSGQTQGLWRYRPTSTSARTLVVRGGHVYTVTDPSGETASDAAVTDLGLIFGTTDNISGAQLGKYFYLVSDAASASVASMYRIDPTYAITAYTSLPTPLVPAAPSDGTLAFVKFSSLAAPTLSGIVATGQFAGTDWYSLDPASVGDTAIYNLGSDQDLTADKWMLVLCSPETQSGGGSTFNIELGTSGGTYEAVATSVGDTAGDGSPWLVYVDLTVLSASTRGAVRNIKFTAAYGTDAFAVSGYMRIPQPPSIGQADYYTSYFNSSTLQESQLSPALTVIYSTPTAFPQVHAAQWFFNSFNDLKTRSLNPTTISYAELWNVGVNKLSPTLQEFAAVKTFTVLAPAGSYDTARLWRATTTGIRLVKSAAITPGGSSVTIRDDQGDTTLAHQLYVASGGPPAATAMCASQGRLVLGGLFALDPTSTAYPNREAISSFLPFASTVDPFPQFPKTGILDADGSFFDIGPSAAEGVLGLVNGDRTAYALTNDAVYAQADLRPGGLPYKIVQKGVIGRRAFCWAEEALFWADYNGVFMARNRSEWRELTKEIRRLWNGSFLSTSLGVNSTMILSYQDRKLYVTKGQTMLRYDFVKEQWSGPHTLTHTMQHCAFWRDPTADLEQMWFLASDGNVYRWQPGHSTSDAGRASDDGGTAIPNWVYSTGYDWLQVKSRMRSVYLNTTGNVTAFCYKDSGTATGSKVFASGEHQYPIDPSVTAYKWRIVLSASPGVFVRRIALEREATAGEGH